MAIINWLSPADERDERVTSDESRADPQAQFSAREQEIMALVATGLSNKEIGRQLGLSDGTVKLHLYKVYQKAGVANRTALAAMVHRNRIGSQQKTDVKETRRPLRRVARCLLILGSVDALCTWAFCTDVADCLIAFVAV
jgi:DNA-binding CsgD family transcriptional regulator